MGEHAPGPTGCSLPGWLSPCSLLCGPRLVEEGGGACLPGHVDQAGDEEVLTLQRTVIPRGIQLVSFKSFKLIRIILIEDVLDLSRSSQWQRVYLCAPGAPCA